MAVIDPSDLTFNGTEIRAFAEAVIEQMVEYPTMEQLHDVRSGIVAKQQIAILGHLSKITRKDLGCGNGKLDKNIPLSEKFWDPVNLKIWLSECWDQFEQTFMVYYLNVGKDKPDLTTTEIFSQWLVDEVGDAGVKDALRIAWFADTAADNVADGGNLTAGVEPLDYTMLDGFWKQIFAIVAGDASRKTTIANNAGVSYAAQAFDDDDTTNKVATGILQNLVMNADRRLRASADKAIWATRSLTDQYIRERVSVTNIELAYTRLESGIDSLTIMGVPVYVMDQWDDVIQSDFDNGTKYYLPHRAIMSTKANLPIGFDTAVGPKDFDVFYDKMSETSNIKGLYKMDVKVIEDYLVQAAY
ncbi:MAG: hypothetical protein K0S09_16 [Sphingobacteriaceae bacterium]|jgi:hypothetical protein|nr:hypothetical protein [Sphingobacteriaceae bacterium]